MSRSKHNKAPAIKQAEDCTRCIALNTNGGCALAYSNKRRDMDMRPCPAEPCLKPLTYMAYQSARGDRKEHLQPVRK